MEEKIQDVAAEFFESGLNCSQSVLISYSEKINIDNITALTIACGFGAGMGRLQQTCGAVTGSFMVISVHNCKKYKDNKSRSENAYSMIQEFNRQFIALHGTTNCMELIKCDLKSEDGRKYALENGLFKNICENCVRDAVTILEELLK